MPRYEQYLLQQSQTGGSLGDLGQIYRGNSWGAYQRGRGLGDYFTSFYRLVRPYLASGLKAVTTEMARGGAEVLGNLGTRPIGDLLRQQRDIGLQNLASKASNKLNQLSSLGRGVKRRRQSYNSGELTGGRIKRRRRTAIRKKKGPVRRRKRRATAGGGGGAGSLSANDIFGGRIKRRKKRRGRKVIRRSKRAGGGAKKARARQQKRQIGGRTRRGTKKKKKKKKVVLTKNPFLQQFLRK